MKSPFPGMDPFIEGCGLWEDFHAHLIERLYEGIADSAPERYLVRTGERSYLVLVEQEGKSSYPFLPDIGVTEQQTESSRTREERNAAVAEESSNVETMTLRAFIEEEHRESFVEIYEAGPEQRLVTCVEVLSPSNKRPGTHGWELYQRKRQSLMLGGVNLVEADLLRGGQRMPMLDPWPECDYTYLVARANQAHVCKIWPIPLLKPLPTLPIPLAKRDPDITLDLRPMIEAIYQRSRYGRSIDYSQPISPPLDDKVLEWLSQQQKRQSEQSDS